ncbi:MAG: amino acid permease [Acidobacteria bacterium]|nr:amino acid permease [Acidobacteriota bacterium]
MKDEGLLRVVGPIGLAAGIVNSVIAAGIFTLPSALARDLGSAAPVAYLAAAGIMACVTISFARAGKLVAQSGGCYAYADAAFGPFTGYLTGIVLWLSNILSSAGISAGLLDIAALPFPALARPLARGAVIVLLYALFAAINLKGVRAGSRVATVAAALKLGALAVFVLLGASLVDPANLAWGAAPAISSVGRGVILAIFALSGMEIALGASGEVRDPAVTIPRALGIAIPAIVLVYLAIQIVAQGILGPDLAASSAPLADALGRVSGSGRSFIVGAAIVSMGGWLASDLLGSSRVLFAFGRAGMLPRALGAVHPGTRVPHVAVTSHAIIACLLALSGTFETLIILSSVATIFLYISCSAASIRLDRRAGVARSPLRGTLRDAVPAAAIAALAGVLFTTTPAEILAISATLLAAAILYGLAPGLRASRG